MTGIRVFAAYLGIVWFLLGFANLLGVVDQVREGITQKASVSTAEDARLDGAEKALDLKEDEWDAKLKKAEERIEAATTALAAVNPEDLERMQNAAAKLERANAQLLATGELQVAAIQAAEERIEAIETTQVSAMDWVRALGSTMVGVLLIAFAWRGPPLSWEDIDDSAVGDSAPAPPAPPAAARAPSAPDDLELDIEDPSDVT
jgi:hypothetical protein